MAHFNMWYQGQRKWNPLKCSGVPDATCPQSMRIAGEYMRGFFTLTNVLNPNLEYDNLGYELPIYQELAKAKVWCISCKEMASYTLNQPQVHEAVDMERFFQIGRAHV